MLGPDGSGKTAHSLRAAAAKQFAVYVNTDVEDASQHRDPALMILAEKLRELWTMAELISPSISTSEAFTHLCFLLAVPRACHLLRPTGARTDYEAAHYEQFMQMAERGCRLDLLARLLMLLQMRQQNKELTPLQFRDAQLSDRSRVARLLQQVLDQKLSSKDEIALLAEVRSRLKELGVSDVTVLLDSSDRAQWLEHALVDQTALREGKLKRDSEAHVLDPAHRGGLLLAYHRAVVAEHPVVAFGSSMHLRTLLQPANPKDNKALTTVYLASQSYENAVEMLTRCTSNACNC